MKTNRTIVVALLLACAPLATAQAPVAGSTTVESTAPGKRTIATTVEIVATVVAIDEANRVATLKGPRGDVHRVDVGPEVRNFDQVKVGDQVAARYVEAVTIELHKAGKAPVARTESQMGGTAPPGEKPQAGIGRQVTVTADVVALDPVNQVARLRGPNGTIDVIISDPEQFKLAKVGDQVETTYRQAFAISVEPVARK